MTEQDLSDLSVEEKLELLKLLEIKDRRTRENWLANYKPYAKQRDFHAAGSVYRERLFCAANQSGKTFSGAAEVAMHTTGLYPENWQGRKFPRATRWIVASESAELTRKGVQRLLLGPPENEKEWGTGAIPKSHIIAWTRKPGVPDAVASLTIRNEYGGESVIQFASYEQGRTKFQADTLDGVWLDEQPSDESIYSEALTRTNATGGIVFITFTPLLGMTGLVRRFLQEKVTGTHVTFMTIDDVEHYTAEQKAAIVASYPEHEREARTRGIPMQGEGVVFPIAESAIRCEPIPIPSHWARICAIDFGFGHPAGFSCLAHDRDSDTVYVYDAWKIKGKSAIEHSMIIIGKGYQHIPWAWPHDGLQHDKGAGGQLVKQYKDYGVNMLAERAQFAPTTDGKAGGNSVEAGIAMMLSRMQTGRFKVFSHLECVFEELRMYHRKDGVVVKEQEDIVSSVRYGTMMLRKAQIPAEYDPGRAMFSSRPDVPRFEVFDPAVGW